MIELPLVLMAGLLGSSHCLGMCGGFALAIGGGASGWGDNLRRQLTYTLGRVFTYTTLGALAGFGGLRLAQAIPPLLNVPAWLAIAAGVLLIYQGLVAVGWIGRRSIGPSGPCLSGSILKTFLTARGLLNVFLAGLFTGLLPCGLLYGMLALAGSLQSVPGGMATMAVFGLGTAPAMVLAGWSGGLLSANNRLRLYRAAAWCVVLTGAVSVVRGATFLLMAGGGTEGGCLLCH